MSKNKPSKYQPPKPKYESPIKPTVFQTGDNFNVGVQKQFSDGSKFSVGVYPEINTRGGLEEFANKPISGGGIGFKYNPKPSSNCIIFESETVYDNPLLNHHEMIHEIADRLDNPYDENRIVELSSGLSNELVCEAVQNNNSDLILAGIMSLDA